MAALVVGTRQHQRITALERKAVEIKTAGGPWATDRSGIIRSGKSRIRPVTPGAAEIFHTVLGLLDTETQRGVSGGSYSVIDHPEIFAAIMKLDLAGQNDLIALIRDSKDPKFSDALYKCMLINLALCAMADRHPLEALEILRHADERIGRFFNKRMGPEPMLQYVMNRLCDVDPPAGMAALVESSKRSTGVWHVEMIGTAIEHDPDLVLETIGKLPESLQSDSWRVAVDHADTRERGEQIFRHLVGNPLPDRGKMTGLLGSLFGTMRKHTESWDGFAGWLGGMNLSEDQKRCIAPALESAGAMGDEKKIAKWLLDFLPPSKERSYLVWRATRGFLEASAPAEAAALLKEQGIDPVEMMELDRQGYLRDTF